MKTVIVPVLLALVAAILDFGDEVLAVIDLFS